MTLRKGNHHRLIREPAKLQLFGAGREKRIYAIPPHTSVVPLDFEDYPFHVEQFDGTVCARCGSTGVYFDEIVQRDDGARVFTCSDTAWCDRRLAEREAAR